MPRKGGAVIIVTGAITLTTKNLRILTAATNGEPHTRLNPARKRGDLNSALSDSFITKILATCHRLTTCPVRE
jgi:hypothetical protein